MRRVAVLLAVVGALSGAAVLLASPAAAHAMVVGSSPAQGAELAHAPAFVLITFDEPVGIDGVGYLHVVDADGHRVDASPATHPHGNAAVVEVALRAGLGPGQYIESYRVVSADSHPVTGAISFAIGPVDVVEVTTSTPQATDPATGLAFDVVRWTSFAGLALVGGGWLVGSVWIAGRRDRRARALAQSGAWALFAGGVLELLVQGPYSAGTGLSHLTDPALVDGVLHSEFGIVHVWRLGLIAALSYVLWTPRRLPARLVAVTAPLITTGIAITFAASGHAWTQHPRWLVVTSDTAHLLAMAAWLGGLVYLLAAVLPSRDVDAVRAVLPTYSRVAFTCVLVLAATGLYQAVRGVVIGDALWQTRYGQLVLLKLVLFVVMVGLGNAVRALAFRRYLQPAAHARSWTVGSAQVDAPASVMMPTSRLVRRTVVTEALTGAVILAATAVLVAEAPGNVALAEQRDRPRTVSVELGAGQRAQVTISPAHTGHAAVSVEIIGGAVPQVVSATAALPARQLGPIPVALRRVSPRAYGASDVLLPAAGAWSVVLDVQYSLFDATTANLTVHIY